MVLNGTFRGSSVYDVLVLRRFAVTSPSPINLLRKSCFIIPTYDVKTSYAWELVGKWSGLILRYADDVFVYKGKG